MKLLESDKEVIGWIEDAAVQEQVRVSRAHLKEIFGDNADILIAGHRYGFISGACQETIKDTVQVRHDASDMIDVVLTNRYLGLPIFATLMFAVFFLTFKIGEIPMGWLEGLFGWLGAAIYNSWPQDTLLAVRSLVVDGIIGGVGGVVIFLLTMRDLDSCHCWEALLARCMQFQEPRVAAHQRRYQGTFLSHS